VDDQFVHTSESGADNAEDLLHQLFEGTHANIDEPCDPSIIRNNLLNETAQYKMLSRLIKWVMTVYN
jgi:hypothetical protein